MAADDSFGCTLVVFNAPSLFWSASGSLNCVPFPVKVGRKTNSSVCLDTGHLENGTVLRVDLWVCWRHKIRVQKGGGEGDKIRKKAQRRGRRVSAPSPLLPGSWAQRGFRAAGWSGVRSGSSLPIGKERREGWAGRPEALIETSELPSEGRTRRGRRPLPADSRPGSHPLGPKWQPPPGRVLGPCPPVPRYSAPFPRGSMSAHPHPQFCSLLSPADPHRLQREPRLATETHPS